MPVVAVGSTDEQTFVDSDFVAHFRCPEQYAGFMLTPADAVQDLRYERYQARERNGLLRQAYYLARPLLPVPIRKHLQRLWFRDWRRIGFPAWPMASNPAPGATVILDRPLLKVELDAPI